MTFEIKIVPNFITCREKLSLTKKRYWILKYLF
jgi:hypothetical protein